MGVKGLTAFLKEHKEKLSYILELKATDTAAPANGYTTAEPHLDAHGHDIDVVVDGWS